MPITEYLVRNARLYGEETSLVEINPELQEKAGFSWRESNLVEADPHAGYRKTMTWREFDDKANRFANLLIDRGFKREDKVAILLMNCIEWLPIYFGALKAGVIVVPLNFRYAADEIKYCLELSDSSALIFGPEFIDRVAAVQGDVPQLRLRLFHDSSDEQACPEFAENYDELAPAYPAQDPMISLKDEDNAAIYFSSGTTGFPKAILHSQASLVSACVTEQAHHGQTREDVFLCIPPLYHTDRKSTRLNSSHT